SPQLSSQFTGGVVKLIQDLLPLCALWLWTRRGLVQKLGGVAKKRGRGGRAPGWIGKLEGLRASRQQ
ncbi:hypothetical protein KUCAC02_008915, partial [Chaenocephalus aceratus]